MHEELSDKELLKSAEEQLSFRALYNRYWEALYKRASHRLGDSEDAQDAVQEVFVSLWRNRESIELEDTLASYLFTAIKYQIIKQVYQKGKRGVQVPLSVESLDHLRLNADDLLHYKELQLTIDREISGLPTRMREIYRLSREENLQIAEIAVRLNISEQTVKNTLTTALRRLRQRLSYYSFLITFFL